MSSETDNQFDVIICGSGSAGLAAATWLSRYGVRCKILERRSGPMQMGQADGVQCRTVEVFESFGLAEKLLENAYQVIEVTFWSGDGSTLKRNSRTADTEPGLSWQPHLIKNQALVNGLLLSEMRRVNNQTVDYGYETISVEVDHHKSASDPESPCVTVVAEKDGHRETFTAKYVLGSDGAHSAVRKSLGFKMIGDSTNSVWGVMDVYPRTNFPDIRKKVVIQSQAGTLMIIPREGQSLARFYIELAPGSVPKDVKLEDLQETARNIFAPYTMDIAETFWWSAYSIGQRLADNFHQDHMVFLTGDACHTHSPKAGQGMNVSLQDGYNIGWKLGAVLTGQANADLLKTYVLERQAVAADLIDFDRKWTKLFKSMHDKENPVTTEEFSENFKKQGRYTAGLTARYLDSMITTTTTNASALATRLATGMRFPSTQVVRHCDARAMHLIRAIPADGRWRILIFPGDINNKSCSDRLNKLATHLSSPTGPIVPLKASTPYIDSFIEPLVILSGQRINVDQSQIADYFWPVTGQWGMRDLHKVYCDDESYNSGHGHAYEFYGVDEAKGAIVIVRPDQYVSMITDLEDLEGIDRFFGGFCCRK